MDFKAQAAGVGGLANLNADALVLVVAGAEPPAGLEPAFGDALKAAVDGGDMQLKAGNVLYAHRVAGVKAGRVVFAAAGDGSVRNVRKAVVAGIGALKGGGAKKIAVATAGIAALDAGHGEALVGAVHDAVYVYRATKPSAPPASKLASVAIVCPKEQLAGVAAGIKQGEAIAAGVELARECANRPGNVCTPSYLAEQAQALGKEFGLKVEVLERKQIEKLGMGSFAAVARGSDEPPKFIVARWMGGAKNAAPQVLVGKGITFDSGGISIKPSPDMDEMKFDMGGAASVLGTLRAIAGLKAKVNVVGIIPACENMPSGHAMKPGDIVTSLSGQTIEVLNTDAEGRLILCDALTYAERFEPAAVVDIATLTGACVIALGHVRSGLFSADDELAGELVAAGDAAGDPAWRMPLDEDYDDALKSNFADMGNVGGRAGGAITAAKFLQRFTGKLRWAHLDVAGTAWKSGAQKGSTGRPVPLLTHWLLGQAAA